MVHLRGRDAVVPRMGTGACRPIPLLGCPAVPTGARRRTVTPPHPCGRRQQVVRRTRLRSPDRTCRCAGPGVVVVHLAERLRSAPGILVGPEPRGERADGTARVRAPGPWTGPGRGPGGARRGGLRRGTTADDPSDGTDRPAGSGRRPAAVAQPGTG